MPDADEILSGLAAVANRGIAAALAWHLVIALALLALARGWRPARRTAGALLASPLASVSAVAFAYGNPFNGVLFAAGAVAMVALAGARERRRVARGPAWAAAPGIALIAFAWVYPHFLEAHPAAYLIAAPVGLIPCPTLSLVIGFALLAGGLGPRAWQLVLAALGLFYGIFGVLRLGVWLDAGLVAGAVVLVATAVRIRPPPRMAERGPAPPG